MKTPSFDKSGSSSDTLQVLPPYQTDKKAEFSLELCQKCLYEIIMFKHLILLSVLSMFSNLMMHVSSVFCSFDDFESES